MLLHALQLALLVLCAQVAKAVPTISVKGADFVNDVSLKRFVPNGVAYQPGGSSGYAAGSDPLSDSSACLRDAALMQALGVNAIRVYSVDPTINHDTCASIFNAVGIYMLIDVNTPLSGESIDRSAPWTSYTTSYLNRTFGVVEAFKDYPNTLLFFAGNEVVNDAASGGIDPPYIRAVVRDIKNYIAKHSTRSIPVGYSAADVRDVLVDTWNYLQCSLTSGTSDPSRVDTFALNSYEWCGNATFQNSGYDVLTADFSNTSVPVFLSEYGCNKDYPRVFTEVQAIFGPEMSTSFSGGMVYEYNQNENNYGLVVVNSNGSAQLLQDYDNLQAQFRAANFTEIENSAASNESLTPPSCSASLITSSSFASNFTLPDTPSAAQELIESGIPNPNNGKIVSVTATIVTQTVQDVSGAIITGLAITPIASDEVNAPDTATTTTSESTGATKTSAAPTSTSSNAAATLNADVRNIRGLMVGGAVAAALCL